MKLPWRPRQPNQDSRVLTRLTDELFAEFRRECKGEYWLSGADLQRLKKENHALHARVVDLKGEERGKLATLIFEKIAVMTKARAGKFRVDSYEFYKLTSAASKIGSLLVAPKGAVSLADFPRLTEAWMGRTVFGVSYARLAGIAEDLVSEHGLTLEVARAVRTIIHKLEAPKEWGHTAEERRQAERFRRILDPNLNKRLNLPEPWQTPFSASPFAALIVHAGSAKSTRMTSKWAATARPMLGDVGPEVFLEAFSRSVESIAQLQRVVDVIHADMLRGLAWFAGLVGTPRAASLLGRLLTISGHKLPGIGARSQKGFSGATDALEQMGTFDALSQLSNARNRIKTPSLSSALNAALRRAAEAQSLPLEDLEELIVPSFGLELPGIRIETLGSVEARLEIHGSSDVELRWFRNGSELKSPPTEVKTDHGGTLKELQATAKEIRTTLAAQKSRIERMMMTGRTLPYPAWRERYIDHPLLTNMSRRIVWRFSGSRGEQLGIATDGVPLNIDRTPLEGLGPETMVRLWHPIDAGVSSIEAWREFLVTNEIRQPFKQAHREIYILTAAEEATNTYSNRFAAHFLKQHQMSALAKGRGWQYSLQGGHFDSFNYPTLDLTELGIRVEYFVQIATAAGQLDHAVMSDTGIALYLVTDQVRFLDLVDLSQFPLEQVPPVVFSEVMRDVDLFVGVSSVGNDPSWSDQGEQFGMGIYWREVSFGDLSATAQTRKDVLTRLLPRLSIAPVSHLSGKFLIVKGKRRTYKIHLGSTNILMEPNDQYLCIVPGSVKGSVSEKLFLPFEGDAGLAIILSKAFMLANDDKITDPTITRQIAR